MIKSIYDNIQNPYFAIPIFSSEKIDIKDLKSQYSDFEKYAFSQAENCKYDTTHRKVIVASNWEEYSLNVDTMEHTMKTFNEESAKKKVILVTNGQNAVYVKMGMKLYQQFKVYRNSVDEIDFYFKKLSGYSFIEKLQNLDKNTIYDQLNVHPILFSFQIGMYHLYKSFGLEPYGIIGFSLGEIATFYITGSVDLETATKIMYHRSILQDEIINQYGGKLMMIDIDSLEYIDKYVPRYPRIEVVLKSRLKTGLSGEEEDLTELVQELQSKNIKFLIREQIGRFHSKGQESKRSEIFDIFKDIRANKPKISWYSTATGGKYTEPVDANYIYTNIRSLIEVVGSILAIQKEILGNEDDYLFLDLSPHPFTSEILNKSIPNIMLVKSVDKNDEVIQFLHSLRLLFCNGLNINFISQF